MRAYKGFNKDLTCRGFQYEEGKTYETDEAKLCQTGFHACEAPLEVLQYYQPSKSRYHVVELDDVSKEREAGSSKVVAKKLTVGAEIGIPGLVKAHIEWTKEQAEKDGAATSGNGSSAATSGEESSAATSNPNGIALACGKNSRAKGVVGSYIILTEWDNKAETLLSARMERVDGQTVKADTWYTLRGGEFVEVKDEN